MRVPFLDLQAIHGPITSELEKAARRVMLGGRFVLGPETASFEEEFAGHCGVAHAIGVGNGLDALHLSLRALGVGPGDEVVVPGNTFVATWLAVTMSGATPVPVDPDPVTLNMTVEACAAAITSRTAAIMPVHLYGRLADVDGLSALATRHGLALVEDAAQAHGARLGARGAAGSFGHAAAFSFYPGKNLGALGDGGAVTTNDPAVAERVRKLRNYGSVERYVHESLGCNSRLDELQAALLRVKLPHLDEWNTRRRETADLYATALEWTSVDRPAPPPGHDASESHVWHLYVVQTDDRTRLQAHLQRQGIETQVHYPTPPHRQAAYADLVRAPLPVTDMLAERVLSLPMGPHLRTHHVERVANAITAFDRDALVATRAV